MSEMELREALRGQIVRHGTPDGDCWCWPLNTPWHEGWVHSSLCEAARAALASSAVGFTGHQRAYPGAVGPVGWQAQAIPAEPDAPARDDTSGGEK